MKKYLTPVSALQFYQLVRYGALVLTGIIFTKTQLTQAEIGSWETFLFLAGAVSFFWLNGFLRALLPVAGETEQAPEKSPAVFTSFVLISAASLLCALLLYSASPVVSATLLNGKEIPFRSLLIIFLVTGTPSSLIEYLYLLKKKSIQIVRYAIISFSAQLTLVIVPVSLGWGIQAAITGLVVSMLLRYGWLLTVLIRHFPLSFSFGFARQYIRLALPLVGATLLGGSAEYVDGFIVTSRFSNEVFAIFRYGARELPLALLMANALSNSMLPEMANRGALAQNLHRLRENSRRIMHLLFPLSMIFILLAHPVFPLLFNPKFAASATIFNIYLLLVISRLLFPQTILIGLKYTRQILIASAFELALNVSLSLLLVRFFGITGIAAATVIAYLFEKMILIRMVKTQLDIAPSAYIPRKLYLGYSAGLLIVFIFAELIF